MAVTPKELLEKLTEGDKCAIEEWEKKIDQYLHRNFTGKAVDMPVNNHPNVCICNKLAELYSQWKIEYKSNQRDGNSILFTPRV
jgi:hypothetical protein